MELKLHTQTHVIRDRETWLEWRLKDLTASDIGALFKAPPMFKSALQPYLEKTEGGEITQENKVMRRGRWLEPAAIEALSEIKPEWKLERPMVYLRSSEHRFGATPDLWNQSGEPVEVKSPTWRGLKKWEDEPPLAYQLQTLAQAMLLDAPRGWLCCLTVDGYNAECQLFEIERNVQAEQRMLEAVAAFWRRVERRDPPDVAPDIDANTVLKKYPEENGTEIDLTGDNRLSTLMPELMELKATRKADDVRIKEIETELKDKMGSAESAFLDSFSATWRTQHRKEYTVKASSTRVLRVKDNRPYSGAAV